MMEGAFHHMLLFEAYLRFVRALGGKGAHANASMAFAQFAQVVHQIAAEKGQSKQESLQDVLQSLGIEANTELRHRLLGFHANSHTVRMPLLSFALSFMMHEGAMLHTLDCLLVARQHELCTVDSSGRIALHWAVAVPHVLSRKCPEPIEHAMPVVEAVLKGYASCVFASHWFGPMEAMRAQDQAGHTPLHVLIKEKHALRTAIGRRLVGLGADVTAVLPLLQVCISKALS